MRAAAFLSIVVVTGCSPVVVSGAFGDRPLRVNGTVAAWIDATEYVVDTAGGTPVLNDRGSDSVVLHLFFSEAVFDPRVDLRALPAGERDAVRAEIERGDRLTVDVQRGDVIRPGDDIELVASDGSLPPEVLPFIRKVAIGLAEPVITEASVYPERAPRVGTKLESSFDVTETSPELVGTLVVKAAKSDGDGDGFLEGTVTLDFSAELLPERLAECNFAELDQGIAGACNLE